MSIVNVVRRILILSISQLQTYDEVVHRSITFFAALTCNIYRPQRSWGKVIFSQASLLLSASVYAGIPQPPPARRPPLLGRQTGRPPLARQTPTPWQGDTPRKGRPPLSSACWEIRSTSGRYSSYWNAILVL